MMSATRNEPSKYGPDEDHSFPGLTWETLSDIVKATGKDEGHSSFEKFTYFSQITTTVVL